MLSRLDVKKADGRKSEVLTHISSGRAISMSKKRIGEFSSDALLVAGALE